MRSALSRSATLTAVAALALLPGCGGGDDGGNPGPASTTPLGAAPPASPPEVGRNVARVGGLSPSDVAAGAILAAYAPEAYEPPKGWVLVPHDRWQEALLAAQFAARPVSGAILPIEKEFLPTASVDLLFRLRPPGFPKGKGLQVLILGQVGKDIFIDLQDQDLQPAQLKAPPLKLAADLVPFRGGWAGKYSDTIVVASAEARDYALPAAAWSAYSGDTLAFVFRDRVPATTAGVLKQRQELRLTKPTIYVVGPPKVIPDAIVSRLRPFGKVRRIAGDTAAETAVAFARYRDPETAFGWGVKRGPASVSLVNAKDWGNAMGAFTFAAAGPQAPLLLTTSAGELPRPVVEYLRDLRGDEPNQGFVFGNEQSIASPAVKQLDKLLEPKGPKRR